MTSRSGLHVVMRRESDVKWQHVVKFSNMKANFLSYLIFGVRELINLLEIWTYGNMIMIWSLYFAGLYLSLYSFFPTLRRIRQWFINSCGVAVTGVRCVRRRMKFIIVSPYQFDDSSFFCNVLFVFCYWRHLFFSPFHLSLAYSAPPPSARWYYRYRAVKCVFAICVLFLLRDLTILCHCRWSM